jgi:hypothetical protein
MDVDACKQVIKSVNDLDIMELQIGRKLSAERLRQRTYLEIEDNVSDFSITSKPAPTQGFAAYHETRSTVGVGNNQFLRSSTRPIINSSRGTGFSFTPFINEEMEDGVNEEQLASFQVDNLTVPIFIYLSTRFLLKHGLGIDGLFQQSGSGLKTTALKTKITGIFV